MLLLIAVVCTLWSSVVASAAERSLWQFTPYRVQILIALERDPALTPALAAGFRRQLMQRVLLIVDAQGFDPAVVVPAQILDGEEAAELIQAGDDLLSELPTVEGLDAVLCDAPERACQVGVPEPLTGIGRFTVD